jgi:hypothetical protein
MAETQLEGGLTLPEGQTMRIGAARIDKHVPGAFRLVTKEDGNGNVIYALQGYFTWTQGCEYGGEWRDLETQGWLHAKDNVPFGPLP